MNNRKGQAYFMVLIATMAMFVSISVVLYVSVNSRQITARYGDFVGRYDLAIAGNEQALFLLMQGFEANRSSILDQAQILYNPPETNKEAALTAAALPYLRASLYPYFTQNIAGRPHRIWNFVINFAMADNLTVQDRFHATTTVYNSEMGRDIFTVRTQISRDVGTVRGHSIGIRARIVWEHPGCICTNSSDIRNCLDDYTLAMVELFRVPSSR